MNRIIKKFAQKIANNIVSRMEVSMKNENDREFKMLLEMGLALDKWCIKRGIELE